MVFVGGIAGGVLCLLTGGVAVREDRLASDKTSSSFSDTSSDNSLQQHTTQINTEQF